MVQLTLNRELGSGALTLAGHPSPNAARACLLGLPHDILVAIFDSIYADYGWGYCKIQTFNNLACVHPLLHHTATAFLHRDVDISILPQKRQTRRLLRRLQKKPSLCRHVRSVSIKFGEICYRPKNDGEAKEDLQLLDDVLACSATAQALEIQCRSSPDLPLKLSAVVPDALAKLPRLESVSLHGDSGPCSIYAAALHESISKATRLQRLSLSGRFGSDRHDMSFGSERHARVEPMNQAFERTSTITEMSLDNSFDGFGVTAQLLRLPKRLKRLDMSAQAGYGYDSQLGLIFAELAFHGDSLEAVDIAYMDDEIGPSIDLRPFTALETLKMSWWSFSVKQLANFSEPLARGLLGPALRDLTWQFNVHEQTQPGVKSMCQDGIAWIHEFGLLAAREKAKLKCIRIEFDPEPYDVQVDSLYYPWDQLDAVKDDLAGRGIELHFKHPYGDKQGFLDYLQGVKDQKAEWDRQIDKGEAMLGLEDHGDQDASEAAESMGEEEQPDFASGQFHLIEGNDIRSYLAQREPYDS